MASGSATFHNLLKALGEQYERDVATARRLPPTQTTQKDLANTNKELQELLAQQCNGLGETENNVLPGAVSEDLQFAGVVPTGSADSTDHKSRASKRTSIGDLKEMRKELKEKEEAEKKQEPTEEGCECSLRKFVLSTKFERCSAGLLILNAMFIGVQVEYQFLGEAPAWIEAVDYVFCAAFLLELLFRMAGFGLRDFWCDKNNQSWNTFDFFIVTSSTADALASIAMKGESTPLGNISILRIVRVVRILRVLRIIRVLKFFQDLRILMASIMSTLKTACWAFILILTGMYMFAVAITQLVAEYVIQQRTANAAIENEEDMMFFFGSVGATIFALFMTIAGGIDWKDAAVPLMEVGPLAIAFFIVFVLLMILCVMNVLTGIFCQSAIDTAQKDQELVMQLQLEEHANYVETLKKLFNSWDDSNDGKCSLVEFANHLHDEATEALLRTLEIETRDALALFELLDPDGKGEIDLDEFIFGCITLRGGAKAVHMERISNMNVRLMSALESVEDKLKSMLLVERKKQSEDAHSRDMNLRVINALDGMSLRLASKDDGLSQRMAETLAAIECKLMSVSVGDAPVLE
mmetsp:Transcript_5059/g.9064  ORF Transcript_5059/g.9064 Transcript_5059/m.9064 type:complete len:581 (+) Transcript_5059:80-1822(+)